MTLFKLPKNEVCQFMENLCPFCAVEVVDLKHVIVTLLKNAGPRSAVGNVSGYRCVSDCRSRGREFDPRSVPYFRGD